MVYLPADVAAGDTLSGTVSAEPAGRDGKTRDANREKWPGWSSPSRGALRRRLRQRSRHSARGTSRRFHSVDPGGPGGTSWPPARTRKCRRAEHPDRPPATAVAQAGRPVSSAATSTATLRPPRSGSVASRCRCWRSHPGVPWCWCRRTPSGSRSWRSRRRVARVVPGPGRQGRSGPRPRSRSGRPRPQGRPDHGAAGEGLRPRRARPAHPPHDHQPEPLEVTLSGGQTRRSIAPGDGSSAGDPLWRGTLAGIKPGGFHIFASVPYLSQPDSTHPAVADALQDAPPPSCTCQRVELEDKGSPSTRNSVHVDEWRRGDQPVGITLRIRRSFLHRIVCTGDRGSCSASTGWQVATPTVTLRGVRIDGEAAADVASSASGADQGPGPRRGATRTTARRSRPFSLARAATSAARRDAPSARTSERAT